MDVIGKEISDYQKIYENYNAVLQWLVAYQKGYKLDVYLNDIGVNTVAVYGMNDIGNCIVREMINSKSVNVLFVVDQGMPKLYFDIECCKVDDIGLKQEPDAFIVALPYCFNEVRRNLSQKTNAKILSITNLVYEMSK